ncbi:Coiled-coil domain-containing protein 94 [Colletotrichum gloeosporioides]|uniref:Splicing factor YJU2 n=1 Tax=Colletotrichum gloeosporioides TaxID=474922 RepID=A0A8H4CWD4_COLGL|nr:Coiled-coil domain-containing protein 94 [Colletotrichum gloeosporioides]KAF3811215.1 Coiled-coil domain-containing protein 94 [Colletotrichum gloeosporioides]
MSERKVLQKYYPPDFNPADITRKRGPKSTGPKCQTVRIMAPYSMKCTSCGEYIYKGRKFNSRKETHQEERYLGIQIHRFSIRCTRCSSEIVFRTDPKSAGYMMVKGAVRNMEPWRNKEEEQESVEERLDRLEREEAEAAGEEERNAMADLEAKNEDARREMAAADALDEIRQRNARIQRSEKDGVDFADYVVRPEDEEKARLEREDDEAARKAFAAARERAAADLGEEIIEDDVVEEPVADSSASSSTAKSETMAKDTASMPPPPPPPAKRTVKKKKDYSAALGIKKKPSLV